MDTDIYDLLHANNIFTINDESIKNIIEKMYGFNITLVNEGTNKEVNEELDKETNEEADDTITKMFHKLKFACPSASRFYSNHITRKENIKLTIDELYDMFDNLCNNECDGCSKYSIDEYPINLLLDSIITTPIIDLLSNSDLKKILSLYKKDIDDNDDIKQLIMKFQLESLEKCKEEYIIRGNNVIEQLKEDMKQYINEHNLL